MPDISIRCLNMPRGDRLSRRERTARTKIIQEHHYNRKEQRRLDRYVEQNSITYNWVYTRIKGGAFLAFMAENGVERIAAAFLKASAQSATVSDAFEKMAKAIRALRAADQRVPFGLSNPRSATRKNVRKMKERRLTMKRLRNLLQEGLDWILLFLLLFLLRLGGENYDDLEGL